MDEKTPTMRGGQEILRKLARRVESERIVAYAIVHLEDDGDSWVIRQSGWTIPAGITLPMTEALVRGLEMAAADIRRRLPTDA